MPTPSENPRALAQRPEPTLTPGHTTGQLSPSTPLNPTVSQL